MKLTQKNQRGAVMAFSLFMLLLLTLVSTSMIQQNKVQISIAANTGQQAQAFASVQTALNQVQAQVNEIRYNGTPNSAFATANKHCHASDSTYGIDQGDNINTIYNTLPGITQASNSAITASVYDVQCISSYLKQPNGSYLGNENQCFYRNASNNVLANGLPNGTRDASSAATATPNQFACFYLNNAGPRSAANPLGWLSGSPGQGCQIEEYTLNVTFQDTTGAARTVQSKFQVDCSNDLNF